MSKIGNKLKSFSRIFRNYTPRKLAITLLAAAAVIVPTAIFAATPTQSSSFTWDSPAPYVAFNSITNNPYWGDEHDFLKIVDANGNLVNNVNVQNGQTYTVEMLVHNDAALNLNLVAKNVTAGIGYNVNNDGTSITLNGAVRTDNYGMGNLAGNTGNIGVVADGATFNGASNFKLSYVPGTANYTTQFTGASYTEGGKTFQLPDSTINSGTNIGFSSMDGNIPGCWPHHGILTAKFTVKEDAPAKPSYDVAKSVDKTSAKAGDTLTYTITAKNTGNQDLANVKINDTLPAHLTAVDGSFTASKSVDGTLPGTVNIAKLAVGETVTMTVKATVNSENELNCGDNAITNSVSSSSDQTNNDDNPNNNNATTNVPKDCTPVNPDKPSANLVKTVDKTSGKNGDVLTYVLLYTNTGNTDLENVVIKDSLPAGVSLVGTIDAAGTNVTGTSDLNKLFTTGAKFAKIAVGGHVRITIQVKVNDDFAKLPDGKTCGNFSRDLINIASATATDENGKTVDETKTDDNKVSTVITEDKGACKPNFDIAKTVDKTSAKPGDTLTYTLRFTNTGNEALTGIVIADKLPQGVSLAKDSVVLEPNMDHSGDLFNGQMLVNGPLAPGASFTITYKVKVNSNIKLACGNNILTNVVSSATSEKPTEDNTDNNTAKTNVPKDCQPTKPSCPTNPSLPQDDPNCKPCPSNPDMNYDNPNCNPIVPPTVTPPTPTTPVAPSEPYNPGTIAATGPVETIAALLAVGALTFGAVAYVNSRRALKANLKK